MIPEGEGEIPLADRMRILEQDERGDEFGSQETFWAESQTRMQWTKGSGLVLAPPIMTEFAHGPNGRGSDDSSDEQKQSRGSN
jgi:hypothetical protein